MLKKSNFVVSCTKVLFQVIKGKKGFSILGYILTMSLFLSFLPSYSNLVFKM